DGRLLPELDGAILAAGNEELAVGTEAHTGDAAGVTAQEINKAALRHVPDLDRPVLARRGEMGPLGVEGHGLDEPGVLAEDVSGAGRSRVPQNPAILRAAERDPPACRADSQTGTGVGASEHGLLRALVRIPDPNAAAPIRRRDEALAVLAEGYRGH